MTDAVARLREGDGVAAEDVSLGCNAVLHLCTATLQLHAASAAPPVRSALLNAHATTLIEVVIAAFEFYARLPQFGLATLTAGLCARDGPAVSPKLAAAAQKLMLAGQSPRNLLKAMLASGAPPEPAADEALQKQIALLLPEEWQEQVPPRRTLSHCLSFVAEVGLLREVILRPQPPSSLA